MAQTPLTTLEDVQTVWGVTPGDTQFNALISKYITQCTAAICDWCNRDDFGSGKTVTEIYSGNGTPTFTTRQLPVTNIASLYYDPQAYFGDAAGAFPVSTLKTEGVDYFLAWDNGPGSLSKSGIITCLNGFWGQPPAYVQGLLAQYPGPATGNIKLTYTYGFPNIPPAVQAACETLIRVRYQMRLYGQTPGSESQEGISYSVGQAEWFGLINQYVASDLAKYRNIVI